MIAPLTDLNKIAQKDFFTNTEARREEYFSWLLSKYDGAEKKVIDGETGTYCYNMDRSSTLFIKDSDLCIIQCYEELESHEKSTLKEKVYTILDQPKTELYIRYVINELTHILETVERFELDEDLEHCKVAIIAKLQDFIKYIENSYLNLPPIDKKYPKIQWLEETKLLTTLFYDLMNGNIQEKKGVFTKKKLIRAKSAEIIKLIALNFLDKEGELLNLETVRTYFNNSKPESRAGDKKKIELFFPQKSL